MNLEEFDCGVPVNSETKSKRNDTEGNKTKNNVTSDIEDYPKLLQPLPRPKTWVQRGFLSLY